MQIRSLILGGILAALLAGSGPAAAQSADYRNMAASLKLNEELFMYLDQFLTNLDEESELKQRLIPEFKKAMLFDYYAQTWYLEGEYGKTRREVNDSRKVLADVYSAVLAENLERVYAVLEKSAPIVAKTHDSDAKFLLTKGFSLYKQAEHAHTEGEHHHILLFTDRINHYREGLHLSRLAGRYAIRALMETKLAREEKPQHMLVTLDDAKSDLELVKPTEHEYVMGLAKKMVSRKQVERKISSSSLGKTITVDIYDMIDDCYGYFVGDHTSLYLEILPTLSVQGRGEKDTRRQPGDP